MNNMVDEVKKLIGVKRNRNTAKMALQKLIELASDKKITLNNTYYVSEWSWKSICDGIFTYSETIRDSHKYDDLMVYCTTTSYRTYFPWDIYESKTDCDEMTKFKNSFGYDWDIENNALLKKIGASNSLGVWK